MEIETPPSGDGQRKRERHRAVPLLPEVRFWNGTMVEIREKADTNEIVITGTPIVYDTPYTVVDMFGEFEERMAPTVADAVLARNVDCRFLFNHDGLPLARTKSGTMTLENTPTALNMSVTLDARQQLANDLMVAIQRGDVAEMSCGFIVARDEWNDDFDKRLILSFADLLDVSAVTYPCSSTTSIAVAKRMALAMPMESRARLKRCYLTARQEGRDSDLLDAIRPMLDMEDPTVDVDPGEDTRTPTGTGRLGSPDGDGKTYSSEDGSAGGSYTGAGDNADASGTRSDRPTEAEHRAQVESLGDDKRAVYEALVASHGDDAYPLDIGRDWIVWRAYGDSPGVYHLPYAVDDAGTVTFRGEPRVVAQAVEPTPEQTAQTSTSSRARALQLRAKVLRASTTDA